MVCFCMRAIGNMQDSLLNTVSFHWIWQRSTLALAPWMPEASSYFDAMLSGKWAETAEQPVKAQSGDSPKNRTTALEGGLACSRLRTAHGVPSRRSRVHPRCPRPREGALCITGPPFLGPSVAAGRAMRRFLRSSSAASACQPVDC